MKRKQKNILGWIGIVIVMLLFVIVGLTFSSHYDEIPAEYQFIVVLYIIFYGLPGAGISKALNFAELSTPKFLGYLPFGQEYAIFKLAGAVEVPSYLEFVISKINLPLIGFFLLIGNIAPIYFVDLNVQMILLKILPFTLIVYFVLRSFYLLFIYNAVYESFLIKITAFIPVLQTITIYTMIFRINQLIYEEEYAEDYD